MRSALEVNFMIGAAIVAYLLAALSALVLFRRAPNKRIKIMTITVLLVCLYEVAKLVQDLGVWTMFATSYLPQMADLTVAAMILVWVLLLKKESSAWQTSDEKFRLAEAAAGWFPEGGEREPPPEERAPLYHPSRWLRRQRPDRHCLHCGQPIRGLWRRWSRSRFCNYAHQEAFFSELSLPRLEAPDHKANQDQANDVSPRQSSEA